MINALDSWESIPTVFGRWQWRCLICGVEGSEGKARAFHFEKVHKTRALSGKTYLLFYESNGNRFYFKRTQNSGKKIPVCYSGELFDRVLLMGRYRLVPRIARGVSGG